MFKKTVGHQSKLRSNNTALHKELENYFNELFYIHFNSDNKKELANIINFFCKNYSREESERILEIIQRRAERYSRKEIHYPLMQILNAVTRSQNALNALLANKSTSEKATFLIIIISNLGHFADKALLALDSAVKLKLAPEELCTAQNDGFFDSIVKKYYNAAGRAFDALEPAIELGLTHAEISNPKRTGFFDLLFKKFPGSYANNDCFAFGTLKPLIKAGITSKDQITNKANDGFLDVLRKNCPYSHHAAFQAIETVYALGLTDINKISNPRRTGYLDSIAIKWKESSMNIFYKIRNEKILISLD